MLLCLTLILGLLPNIALAIDTTKTPDYQENVDVSVTYDDVDRTHATVRYHKPRAQVNSYNIIFLVDTSVQGKDSFESFEKMMVESGADTIFNSISNNQVSLINYTTTAETNRVSNRGFGKNEIYALMSRVIYGAGTANEIAALDAALAEVKSLKSSEKSPTRRAGLGVAPILRRLTLRVLFQKSARSLVECFLPAPALPMLTSAVTSPLQMEQNLMTCSTDAQVWKVSAV